MRAPFLRIVAGTALADPVATVHRMPTEPILSRRSGRPLPEPRTESCRNQRLRLKRCTAWWASARLTSYWRARLDWQTALSNAQDHVCTSRGSHAAPIPDRCRRRQHGQRRHRLWVACYARDQLGSCGGPSFWLGSGPARKLQLPSGLLLGYPEFMAKSIRDIPKKQRGRPSTGGRREGVLVRLEPAQFEALDGWIKKHGVKSRPEAIRRLVELGLKAKK